MVFASIVFLYYYLPLVLIAYFFAPHRAKNTVLLLASLFFYFYGEPVYLILMLIAAYSAYRHGLYIDKFRGRKYARLLLVSSLVVSIGLLVLNYTDFLLANINVLFNTNFARLNLVQPIGISFYTFQILSYTIEVYRDQVKVQKSFAKFLLYVSFFPQLIAGPIVRYTTVAADLESRTHSWVGFAGGVRRFIIGLAKVLLANVLGELCSSFKMSDEKSVLVFLAVRLGLYPVDIF